MFYFEVLEQNLLVLMIIEAALTFSIHEGIFFSVLKHNLKQRSFFIIEIIQYMLIIKNTQHTEK